MNKKLINISIFSIFSFLVLFLGTYVANATVGGPTYIYDFKYNPGNESVYYVKKANDGRGCPPVLMRTSLSTTQSETVYSCEQGEKVYQEKDYNTALLQIRNEINSMITGFKDLSPINLKKNNISIDIQFLKSEELSPELDEVEIKNSLFNAIIYQDKKKITEISLSGCNKDQPFTFAGYAIPGFEKKIMLLLSTKSDCFEGGYTGESLIVLGGLEYANKDYLNFYKGEEPLVPNEGTLTIYEGDEVLDNNSTEQTPTEARGDAKQSKKNAMLVFISIICLLLGFLMGRITKKVTKTSI